MTNILSKLSELLNPSSKNAPFAVLITDTGESKLYIKKFKRLLTKYPGLLEASSRFRRKSLKNAEYLDLIVFGNNSSFDYIVLENELEMLKIQTRKIYQLVEDYDQVVKALEEYVEKNNIRKEEDVDIEINLNITIEEAPVKPKKVATYEVVDIFDTFVRVGWDIYEIYVDTYTGKELVKIGNKVFQIKKNLFGQKYLSR
jgi:hypothetical protein